MADKANKSDHRENHADVDVESIDDMTLESAPVQDRLPPMLFLAALIHGILIIGITFNAVLSDEFAEAISLEVTIVADPDPNTLEPDRAAYLTQANQNGAGNTQEQARPSARAESVVPVDNVGTEDGDSLDESLALEQFSDEVLTANADLDFEVPNDPRKHPSPDETKAANLESDIELTIPLPQDEKSNPFITDENPRELVTSVDKRESKIAGYLSRWKTKIETVGSSISQKKRLRAALRAVRRWKSLSMPPDN